MKEPRYKAAHGPEDLYYIESLDRKGPYSYYGGRSYPNSKFNTRTEAQLVAVHMNTAYEAGYAQAQRDIKAALGVKE